MPNAVFKTRFSFLQSLLPKLIWFNKQLTSFPHFTGNMKATGNFDHLYLLKAAVYLRFLCNSLMWLFILYNLVYICVTKQQKNGRQF